MSSILQKDPSIDVLCCAVEPFYEDGGKKVRVYGAVDNAKSVDDLDAPSFDESLWQYVDLDAHMLLNRTLLEKSCHIGRMILRMTECCGDSLC